MLALIHHLNDKNDWQVSLAWVFDHDGIFVGNNYLKPEKVKKASLYILDGDTIRAVNIEHFEYRISAGYFVFLDEWEVMWKDLFQDYHKRRLHSYNLYGLSRIIEQVYGIKLKY